MSNKSRARVEFKRYDIIPKWIQKSIAVGLGMISGIFMTLVIIRFIELIVG